MNIRYDIGNGLLGIAEEDHHSKPIVVKDIGSGESYYQLQRKADKRKEWKNAANRQSLGS